MDTTKEMSKDDMKADIAQMLSDLDTMEQAIGKERETLTEAVEAAGPKRATETPPVKKPNPSPAPGRKNATINQGELNEIKAKLKKLDDMEEEICAMKAFMEEKLGMDFKAMYDNVLDQMNVEAIKTYRNIQAVIVEEDAKQNHALFGIDGKSDSLKRRLNNVMIFSIVSFVTSILVMLMQVLPAFGIKLFG